MLQKYLLFFFLLIAGNSAFSQTFDCYKFKTGKFRVADPRVGGVTITERQGGYQTETNDALKLKVRFIVNWLSDCSFTLKLDKVVRNENKLELPSNITVNVTIISTERSSYTQEISSSMYSSSYRCTVTKL